MARCGAHAYSQPECDQRPHAQTAHNRTIPPVNAWYLCLHPCPRTRLPYAYMPGTTQAQCMLHISLCITTWPTHSPGLCPLQDPRPMPAHASSRTRSVQLTCACTHACSCTHCDVQHLTPCGALQVHAGPIRCTTDSMCGLCKTCVTEAQDAVQGCNPNTWSHVDTRGNLCVKRSPMHKTRPWLTTTT